MVTRKNNRRTKVSRLRNYLYLRQNGECIFCDKKTYKIAEMTIEHIIPGLNIRDNYVLSCSACNSAKSDFFLFYGERTRYRELTEDILYRSLVMQIYLFKKYTRYLWDF